MVLPRVPIGEAVEGGVNWIYAYFSDFLNNFSSVLGILEDAFKDLLLFPPPIVMILIICSLIWLANKRNWKLILGTVLGLLLIESMGLWEFSMVTLALVITSTFLAMLIGLPIGILSSRSNAANHIVTPLLDFMQTMPSFVYLIPAMMFFGVGNVPGVIATVVFATPPIIRLTNLGIRQVPEDLVEVADVFGSTPWQKLVKVQLPLAMPTIMAGVNQCIMLALSMVVIAAMIGAGGLGEEVLKALMRMKVGPGFEAGLGIVIIAMILDRTTRSLTER